MSLTIYRKKRRFKLTPEPKGKANSSSNALQFVVQKHAASQLHYDFRLELDGVLKSWAVPKGPSMNPADKRLAIMVEDHPFEYKDFEGTIPEGNYGAGKVIVWDKGVYHPFKAGDKKDEEKELSAGLKKGHITFILEGQKLKGEFALVKLNGKQPNTWLLIKKNDRYATEVDILKKKKSAISNITLESVISEKKPSAKKRSLPKPMLAKIEEKPFDSDEWVFEEKYDGYRALALCNGERGVKLYSRNLLSFNERYKPIVEGLKKINDQCLLDGEIVIEDSSGKTQFQLLQNYLNSGKGELKYYVFDLLQLNNHDTTGLPLLKRKELLNLLLDKAKLKGIFYSEHMAGNGIKCYKSAVKKGWEGIMAKRADSTYTINKRSSDWLKIKITKQQEALIAGFTAPKGNRDYFGAILLGAFKDGKLKYIGRCGTGFDNKKLKALYKKFEPLFMLRNPFNAEISGTAVQWIKPKLVCEVKFSGWTKNENMRHPVYQGLRDDINWKEVKIEKVAYEKPKRKTTKQRL